MKKCILYLITIVGLFVFGCSTRTSTETLIFNLKSYSSVSEIQKLITSKKGTYKIIKSRLSNLKNQPKSEIITIKTNLFTDNGFKGITQITFWNNRLMEIVFSPNNHIQYMQYFRKKYHIDLSNIKENKYLRIEIIKDYQGIYRVVFTDMRLEEEMNTWIRKYS